MKKNNNNERCIVWKHPRKWWHKLNVDGSIRARKGIIGVGGIIHNHEGNKVKGFNYCIGKWLMIKDELKAIKQGLQMALDLRIENIHIEFDLQHPYNALVPFYSWRANSREAFLHIYREKETKLLIV